MILFNTKTVHPQQWKGSNWKVLFFPHHHKELTGRHIQKRHCLLVHYWPCFSYSLASLLTAQINHSPLCQLWPLHSFPGVPLTCSCSSQPARVVHCFCFLLPGMSMAAHRQAWQSPEPAQKERWECVARSRVVSGRGKWKVPHWTLCNSLAYPPSCTFKMM